jgi:hypothetical protein
MQRSALARSIRRENGAGCTKPRNGGIVDENQEAIPPATKPLSFGKRLLRVGKLDAKAKARVLRAEHVDLTAEPGITWKFASAEILVA